MGAGSSVPTLKKARSSVEDADLLFGSMDRNNDGLLSLVEIYDAVQSYSEKVQAEWQLDDIKETVARFDANSDGMLDRDEFQAVLDNMMDKPRKSVAVKRKSLGGKLKKAWTWRKLPSLADVAQAAKEEAEEAAEEAGVPSASEYVIPTPMTDEEKEAAFWNKQDAMLTWNVPFGFDKARMPWLKDGQSGLSAAFARARAHEKTPLVVDNSYEAQVDAFVQTDAVVLIAKQMFLDEKSGVRTHDVVMRDTRKLLVEAMRDGKRFVIALENKATDFAGGVFSGPDWLPMSVFDQRVVNALDFCMADSPRRESEPFWQGLWESDHPFAQVLRESDLLDGAKFFVGRGFEVVVTTHLPVDQYIADLRNSMPMGRLKGMQAIKSVLGD